MDLTGFRVYSSPRVIDIPAGTPLYTDLRFDARTSIIVQPGRTMPVAGKFRAGPFLVGVTPEHGTATERLPWRIARARDVPSPRDAAP